MDRLKWIEQCAWRDAHRILDLESEELQMWAQGLTDSLRYADVQDQLEILRSGPVNQAMLEQARRQRLQRRYRPRPQRTTHPVGYHHWKADGTVVVHDPFEHPTTYWVRSRSPIDHPNPWTPISDLPELP